VRETVNAVEEMGDPAGVTAVKVAKRLSLDKASASRRLRDAGERGYLSNLETRRGQPGKWIAADPMPDGIELLPAPETLEPGCAVVSPLGGDTPPPPLDEASVAAVVDLVIGGAS
jgi:hypothetical protein